MRILATAAASAAGWSYSSRNIVMNVRHSQSLIDHHFPSRHELSLVFSLSSSDTATPDARSNRIGATKELN
jgi:hypothetical protein